MLLFLKLEISSQLGNCYLQRITKRSLPFHNHSDIFNTCPSLEEMEHQFAEGFGSTSSAIKSLVTSSRVQTAATTNYNFSWNFEPKHIGNSYHSRKLTSCVEWFDKSILPHLFSLHSSCTTIHSGVYGECHRVSSPNQRKPGPYNDSSQLSSPLI